MVRKRFAFVAALVALLVLLWATGGVVAGPPRPEAEGEISAQGDVEASAAVTYGINYQGRLTDAAGNPVPDGSYTIHFRLYDVPSGGTPLSTDTDPVSVSDGPTPSACGRGQTSVGSQIPIMVCAFRMRRRQV